MNIWQQINSKRPKSQNVRRKPPEKFDNSSAISAAEIIADKTFTQEMKSEEKMRYENYAVTH